VCRENLNEHNRLMTSVDTHSANTRRLRLNRFRAFYADDSGLLGYDGEGSAAACLAAKGSHPSRRRNIATSSPQVGPLRKLLRGSWADALGEVEGFRHAKANIL
jgi:hypothetical protein